MRLCGARLSHAWPSFHKEIILKCGSDDALETSTAEEFESQRPNFGACGEAGQYNQIFHMEKRPHGDQPPQNKEEKGMSGQYDRLALFEIDDPPDTRLAIFRDLKSSKTDTSHSREFSTAVRERGNKKCAFR